MMPARDIRAQGGRSGALNINHKLCLGRERQRVSEEKRKKEKKIYNRLGWWRQPNSDEIEQDGIKNRTRRALGVTVCVCVCLGGVDFEIFSLSLRCRAANTIGGETFDVGADIHRTEVVVLICAGEELCVIISDHQDIYSPMCLPPSPPILLIHIIIHK